LMQPQPLGSASPPHVRSRLMTTMRQPVIQDLLHDPINSSYLSFHIQGSSGDRESARRRPDIGIMGNAPGPSGSSTDQRSSGLDTGVVVPPLPIRTGAATQHLQMSFTQTITQASVHETGTTTTTTRGQLRVVEDWPLPQKLAPLPYIGEAMD
jgi:hypothetical protein